MPIKIVKKTAGPRGYTAKFGNAKFQKKKNNSIAYRKKGGKAKK